MSIPLCYYGSTEAPPQRTLLKAGPLTAWFEQGDLRYVRLGTKEVVRRWYVAVRDRNWGTVPFQISDLQIDQQADQFQISYRATHQQRDIHFVWQATIVGESSGKITFTMAGEAQSTFLRNRIGFCILHPIQECAGQTCRVQQADGHIVETSFPKAIAPQNPFQDLTGLAHQLDLDCWAEWTFHGDYFETEDQRNWMDASFKTFCTPLRLPFPMEVAAGTLVEQTVTLNIQGQRSATAEPIAEPTFHLLPHTIGPVPSIGLAVAHHGLDLTSSEIEHLRRLRPSHLRVEVNLTQPHWSDRFLQALSQAHALQIPLEVALTVSDDVWTETVSLIEWLQQQNPPIVRVLLYHNQEWTTPLRIIPAVWEALARYDSSIPVFVGTQANFTELNRGRPPVEHIREGACFSIQPQEHAFDHASLTETCAALADVLASAKLIYPSLPLCVSPVTLKKRVNPYATGPAAPVPPGELPPTVDVRQMSLFGAGWTLGTLKYLLEGGVHSITFYETTGWQGVIEQEQGCPLPDKFPSQAGMVFPLYHVLADVFEFGGQVYTSTSSQPLQFDGLRLRKENQQRVLLANWTHEPQSLQITGLGSQIRLRLLDAERFAQATQNPLEFRSDSGETHNTNSGTFQLSLPPYAYVRIDSSE